MRKAKSLVEHGCAQLPGRPVYMRSVQLSAEHCADVNFKICCRTHQVRSHKMALTSPGYVAAMLAAFHRSDRKEESKGVRTSRCAYAHALPGDLIISISFRPHTLSKPSSNSSFNLSACQGLFKTKKMSKQVNPCPLFL